MLLLNAIAWACCGVQDSPPRAEHPGAIVLLGESMREADVPELAQLDGARVSLGIDAAPEERQDAGELVLEAGDRDAADDAALCAAVQSARCVQLTRGSWREWRELLWARGKQGELVGALDRSWRAGATLVGRGDGAALLCASAVIANPSELGIAECDPHDLALPALAGGLGFQAWSVLDTDGRSAGRFERVFELATCERFDAATWLDDRAACVVERSRGKLVCRGSYLLVLDLRNAKRGRHSLRDLRISILRDGDAWLERRRTVEHAQAARELAGTTRAVEIVLDDVFAADALVAALDLLAVDPPARISVRDARRALSLELDPDSSLARAPDGRASWARVRADFEWSGR